MKKSFSLMLIMAVFFLLSGCASNNQSNYKYDPDLQQLYIGDDIAIAQTQYGKVKGYILRGVYTYLGIPYGANTTGDNRFMPPQPPEPWDDIRPAVWYGNSAPQSGGNYSPESYSSFQDHWNYDAISEDCLRLNIWTPGVDKEKRPVLVWIHGGAFHGGNSIEQDGYHGENFARREDAVFVSINHRLNAFGFSNFSTIGGEKYKHSANVGMLDIIAALQWINNNIENFGGDPENVTIIGQSGGGRKVAIVSTMPAAKGLVNKAVLLSSVDYEGRNREIAELTGEYILKEAGLEPSQIDELQQMPWEEYYELANRASRKMVQDLTEQGNPPAGYTGFFPVGDDIDIPEEVFFNAEDPDLPDIPMLLCTTFHEATSDRDRPEMENMTAEEVIQEISSTYGDYSREIYEEYARIFPDNIPFENLAMIRADRRTEMIKFANIKVKQSSPVYLSWFGWCSPNFDGRQRAFHCADICFWLNNTDLMLTHTGGGKQPRMLSEKMSDALGAFMRTGDPNTKNALPEWPQYSVEECPTMMLNNTCEVRYNPDGDARALMEKALSE